MELLSRKPNGRSICEKRCAQTVLRLICSAFWFIFSMAPNPCQSGGAESGWRLLRAAIGIQGPECRRNDSHRRIVHVGVIFSTMHSSCNWYHHFLKWLWLHDINPKIIALFLLLWLREDKREEGTQKILYRRLWGETRVKTYIGFKEGTLTSKRIVNRTMSKGSDISQEPGAFVLVMGFWSWICLRWRLRLNFLGKVFVLSRVRERNMWKGGSHTIPGTRMRAAYRGLLHEYWSPVPVWNRSY